MDSSEYIGFFYDRIFWVFFWKIFAGTLLPFLFFKKKNLSKKIYESKLLQENFVVFFVHLLNMNYFCVVLVIFLVHNFFFVGVSKFLFVGCCCS